MSEITIRLIYNLQTGKKDVYVDFESDADALPIEHEEDHRRIVGELLGRKVISADELGEVVVTRGEADAGGSAASEEDASEEPLAEGQ